MKNLTKLKVFITTMIVMIVTLFTSCVDDNKDTEAPYLEISPATLIFNMNGTPAEGSQASFDISTNRNWKATIKEEDSWVTLSKTQGEGSASIQVSIPEGPSAQASIVIEVSNKVGTLMSKTVTITRGDIVNPDLIYNETFGTKGGTASPYPFVDQYLDWVKSGEGSETVDYIGVAASLRQSGSTSVGYEGASGGTKLFFGENSNFVVNKISLKENQTNLRLTFGGVFYNFATKDNVFKPEQFHFYLSADGTTWSNAIEYTIKNAEDNWVFATSNFTLKEPTSKLYIKFAADIASVFSIDDPTLTTGNGGPTIDLGGSGPAVFTADATAITSTSATLGGSIANIDLTTLTEVGVQYAPFSTGSVNDIDWTASTRVAATTKATPWTVAISSLTKDSQYAFRSYAKTATEEIFGQPKSFVAKETVFTPISIAELVLKMTDATTGVAVDNDYVIEGVICSDPTGLNYSFGTIYLMTQGATTSGNALSLYNTKIDVAATYSLGEKIKVSLRKDAAKIYKRYDVPQVEGFEAADIVSVSKDNAVNPIKVTIDKLSSFVCMPVTIDNANIATGGIWKEAGAMKSHTFNVSGTTFVVNFNKQATTFDDQPFKAATGSITGIASIYQNAGQLVPRNLKDVEAFKETAAIITSVDPESWSFSAEGGTKTFQVTVANIGSNQLSATGLSGILSATVSGTTVTVTSGANTSANPVNQTLTISLTNGNKTSIAIKVKGVGETDTKGIYTSMSPFLFDNGSAKTNAYSQKISVDGNELESLKLGTGSKSGTFTTGVLGESGNKKLSFYAAAWKGESMTVYIRVNGGGNISGDNNILAAANAGVAGTGTFTVIFKDSDYYTLNLTDLTPSSTITIATDPDFNGAGGKARGLMCGFQLY